MLTSFVNWYERLVAVSATPPTDAAQRGRWLLSGAGVVVACLFLLLLLGHFPRIQTTELLSPLWAGMQVVRALLLLVVSVWLGWRAQWQITTSTDKRVGGIITTLCSIATLATSTYMWLDPGLYHSIITLLGYTTITVQIAQVWWIARHGYVRLAAPVFLLGCLLVVLTRVSEGGALHTMTVLLGYTLLILVGGLLVRWWVGFVLAVALPIMHTALQATSQVSGAVSKQWTLALIILLGGIAGVVALYTRSLERALQLSDLHAEQLRAAQTELEQMITDQEASIAQATAQLRHQAYHDSLTGLANRARFLQQVHASVLRGQVHGTMLAVLFLDLDGFKAVNDSLGHEAGDALLVVVAARLQACVREEDTVARLGGDEFTVLLADATNINSVLTIVERIITALGTPVALGDRTVQVTSSIGIAISHAGEHTVTEFLRRADVAMYYAKQHGKARYALFELHMGVGVETA